MGYRIYIGAINNTKLDRIKNIDSIEKIKRIISTWNSKISLDEDEKDYLFVGDITDRNIDQIGDVAIDTEYIIPQIPLFLNEDVNKKVTEENHLFLLPKENLLLLIRAYQKRVAKYLSGIIEDTKRKEEEPYAMGQTALQYLEQKAREWSRENSIIDVNEENKERIVSSWDYEYNIFDLVHLYKSFDFDNETLVVFAY